MGFSSGSCSSSGSDSGSALLEAPVGFKAFRQDTNAARPAQNYTPVERFSGQEPVSLLSFPPSPCPMQYIVSWWEWGRAFSESLRSRRLSDLTANLSHQTLKESCREERRAVSLGLNTLKIFPNLKDSMIL